jgi:inner membrane protein
MDVKTAALSAGVAGIAALLPDLDDPHSKLGRLVTPASWVIKATVGHRGPLHSLIGATVMTLLVSFVLSFVLRAWYGHTYMHAQMLHLQHWYDYNRLLLLVLAGCFSHLVMDSLNPQGVPWLWPMKKHFGLPLVQTGSVLERLAVTPAMALLVAWLGVTKLWL